MKAVRNVELDGPVDVIIYLYWADSKHIELMDSQSGMRTQFLREYIMYNFVYILCKNSLSMLVLVSKDISGMYLFGMNAVLVNHSSNIPK